MQRRVVVTGIGVISAVGHNWCEFWTALREGRSGIGPLEAVDRTLLRFQNAAEVRNYVPANYFDEKEIGLLDRFAQFGVVAAREAVGAARIDWTPELREETAIVTGSCVGGQTTEDEGFVNLYRNSIRA
jgi:nodulation protein E